MKNMMRRLLTAFIALSCLAFAPFAYAQSVGEDLFLQGNQLYNQKKFAEAVASYGRAIQAQPQSLPKAYLNCARAYSMQKNYGASMQYYTFYAEVEPTAATDKKYKAEVKAIEKKAKSAPYERAVAQTTVLKQLEQNINAGGPYWTRQGNGALAYYDVLIRAGFAEPKLYQLQQQIVNGLVNELENDIRPPAGQPLPNLDRTGWEHIRAKIAKTRQFLDVQPNAARMTAIESLAFAWEAFYRGDSTEAEKQFALACKAVPAIPAAHWGRVMLSFQLENNDVLIEQIDTAERIYKDAGISHTTAYFALLRAQLYRNLGDTQKSLEWLSIMQSAL